MGKVLINSRCHLPPTCHTVTHFRTLRNFKGPLAQWLLQYYFYYKQETFSSKAEIWDINPGWLHNCSGWDCKGRKWVQSHIPEALRPHGEPRRPRNTMEKILRSRARLVHQARTQGLSHTMHSPAYPAAPAQGCHSQWAGAKGCGLLLPAQVRTATSFLQPDCFQEVWHQEAVHNKPRSVLF